MVPGIWHAEIPPIIPHHLRGWPPAPMYPAGLAQCYLTRFRRLFVAERRFGLMVCARRYVDGGCRLRSTGGRPSAEGSGPQLEATVLRRVGAHISLRPAYHTRGIK